MSLNIIVLAKQVPDTRNVGKDAMKEDGTINRAALPAIFNPEDLNALEQALRLKETHPGSTITLLTMGLPRAAEIVREAIYRGADSGIVLTDRALGGADTLATSYSLAQAVKKIGDYDIILRPPGYRRRYRAGRSPDCRKTRYPAGYLCRGDTRSRKRKNYRAPSSRKRCGDRCGSHALCSHCKRQRR